MVYSRKMQIDRYSAELESKEEKKEGKPESDSNEEVKEGRERRGMGEGEWQNKKQWRLGCLENSKTGNRTSLSLKISIFILPILASELVNFPRMNRLRTLQMAMLTARIFSSFS